MSGGDKLGEVFSDFGQYLKLTLGERMSECHLQE